MFRPRGHVGLTWTLCPWPWQFGEWSTSVTTWLEAGEQTAASAADVASFLSLESDVDS